MWQRLAGFVLKFRLSLLIALLALTALMGYYASKVQLSYESNKAIPTDNPKYMEYLDFKKLFGEDGNMVVLGVQTDSFFNAGFFNDYVKLNSDLKNVKYVENVLSVPAAINLVKNDSTHKLAALPL